MCISRFLRGNWCFWNAGWCDADDQSVNFVPRSTPLLTWPLSVSLVVILFEVRTMQQTKRQANVGVVQLTGALSHVLPIMICVMTSKWVGDALGKDGIYAVWIALRRYPWLPQREYHDHGETGAQLMTPTERLSVIEDEHYTMVDLGIIFFVSYEILGIDSTLRQPLEEM